MPTSLVVRDESLSGEVTNEMSLDFDTTNVTVREIIRSRVYQEVSDYNAGVSTRFRGLVQPQGSTVVKDGFLLKERRHIDWNEQFSKALEAFQAGRIIVIAGDRQVETLEEEVGIDSGCSVSFLRLVPLVGG